MDLNGHVGSDSHSGTTSEYVCPSFAPVEPGVGEETEPSCLAAAAIRLSSKRLVSAGQAESRRRRREACGSAQDSGPRLPLLFSMV